MDNVRRTERVVALVKWGGSISSAGIVRAQAKELSEQFEGSPLCCVFTMKWLAVL